MTQKPIEDMLLLVRALFDGSYRETGMGSPKGLSLAGSFMFPNQSNGINMKKKPELEIAEIKIKKDNVDKYTFSELEIRATTTFLMLMFFIGEILPNGRYYLDFKQLTNKEEKESFQQIVAFLIVLIWNVLGQVFKNKEKGAHFYLCLTSNFLGFFDRDKEIFLQYFVYNKDIEKSLADFDHEGEKNFLYLLKRSEKH
jgi:hypothetical protein